MSTSQSIFFDKFHKAPIIGILRGFDLAACRNIAMAYQKAGLTSLEITMNSPQASETIAALLIEFPELNIGAGTVVNKADLDLAINAGAQFIVTPIIDKKVVKTCIKRKIPIFPGAYSPLEIYKAWNMGATAVKVFPATQLGPSFIKDVLAPLNQIKLVPTGGVSLHNIKSFFEVGAYGVGMGSSLIDKELVENKNWKALEVHFRKVKKRMDT